MEHKGIFREASSDVKISLMIQPHSPILIQSPDDKNGNTIHLLSNKKGNEETYYIPGSSIKGVLRNHSEKIFYHLLSIHPQSDKEKKKKDHSNAANFYHNLNPVNQLFGHIEFKSRLTIDDAFFDPKSVVIDRRVNVAIDRFRGGQKDGALFETEMLVKGRASLTIRLKNPTEWQLFWLMLLLRDFQDGKIRVGAKTSIGFGQLSSDLIALDVSIYNRELEKSWSYWLEKGKYEKKIYSTYTFTSLNKVAPLLEHKWIEYLDKFAREKEGVSK